MQITLAERVRLWLPALLWAALILSSSGDTASAEHTGGWLKWLLPHASQLTLDIVNIIMRKLAHVTGYGLLGFLNARALRARGSWTWRSTFIAAALAAVVAIVDELHQSVTTQRTGTLSDVLLDTSGAFAAAALLRRRMRHASALPDHSPPDRNDRDR